MIADGTADSCAHTGLDLHSITQRARSLGDSPLPFNVFSLLPCKYIQTPAKPSSPTQVVRNVVLPSSRIPSMARFKGSTRRIYRCAGRATKRSGRRSRGSSHLDRDRRVECPVCWRLCHQGAVYKWTCPAPEANTAGYRCTRYGLLMSRGIELTS
jgi:hypothetical protein